MNLFSTSRLHSASSETSSTPRPLMYGARDAKKVLTKTYQIFWQKKHEHKSLELQISPPGRLSVAVTLHAKASWSPPEDNASTTGWRTPEMLEGTFPWSRYSLRHEDGGKLPSSPHALALPSQRPSGGLRKPAKPRGQASATQPWEGKDAIPGPAGTAHTCSLPQTQRQSCNCSKGRTQAFTLQYGCRTEADSMA